ncbi:MAG TPA: helix-turn-helix domain-containing protein [Kofleriaceae bacterium]|nr:helix-turn-helix domain-containing protein [Kofleriaceae bacterium]
MKTTREKNAAYLAEQLRARIPDVDLKVHAPSGKGKVWWIDATFRRYSVAIEWSKEDGFGLSTPTEDDYGSAANEVYVDADEAVDRTVQLLKTGYKARARREMHLKALREHRKVSQESLARLMQLSQAAISKTERRGDMLLSTLQSFIEALGGELHISAKFPTETIELDLLHEDDRKRSTPHR